MPVAYFRDPFRKGNNVIVMCEAWKYADATCQKRIPANTNFRHFANMVWNEETVKNEKTWYGIEQEYTLVGKRTKFTTRPLGWPSNGYPSPQGPFYCSVGANVCFGRAV